MNMFYILIRIVVAQVYTFVNIYELGAFCCMYIKMIELIYKKKLISMSAGCFQLLGQANPIGQAAQS